MSDNHHVNYRNVYLTLVGLLIISVAGPFVGVVWVTLITAFGIALVKAYLVIENFMHLRWEKRLMKWMLTCSLILMALMFAGVSPDVMKHTGRNWVNESALAATERGIPLEPGEEGEEEAVEVAAATPGVFSAETTFKSICATCHGQAGDGTGPAGAALDPHPANFTDPEFWATRDSTLVFNAIKNGAASVGGSPLMVAWKNSFSDDQIQQLAAYVLHFKPQ